MSTPFVILSYPSSHFDIIVICIYEIDTKIILRSGQILSCLNYSLLAQAIRGIPYSNNISEFQSLCNINSYTTSKELLRFLSGKGIGNLSETKVRFTSTDKMKLLLLALQLECDPDLLSLYLNWKDFENFVTIILQAKNYVCRSNIHLTMPRIQIDVVATLGGMALIIDCKHWRNMAVSKMLQCANQQYARTKIYVEKNRNIDCGLPVIVTLNEVSQSFVNKIPFVPISRLDSFLKDYDLYSDQLCIVKNNRNYK